MDEIEEENVLKRKIISKGDLVSYNLIREKDFDGKIYLYAILSWQMFIIVHGVVKVLTRLCNKFMIPLYVPAFSCMGHLTSIQPSTDNLQQEKL